MTLAYLLYTLAMPPGTPVEIGGGHQYIVRSAVYRDEPVFAARPSPLLLGMRVTMYDPWSMGVYTAEERGADGHCRQEESGSMWRTGILSRDAKGRYVLYAATD